MFVLIAVYSIAKNISVLLFLFITNMVDTSAIIRLGMPGKLGPYIFSYLYICSYIVVFKILLIRS